jgi:hypothetical protein
VLEPGRGEFEVTDGVGIHAVWGACRRYGLATPGARE